MKKTDEIKEGLRRMASDPVVRRSFKELLELDRAKAEQFKRDYAKALESGAIQQKPRDAE